MTEIECRPYLIARFRLLCDYYWYYCGCTCNVIPFTTYLFPFTLPFSRFSFWRWNFSNSSPPFVLATVLGIAGLMKHIKIRSMKRFEKKTLHLFRAELISGSLRTADAFLTGKFVIGGWIICWIWLGTMTRSLNESRRELFAVDGVVLGLSRPVCSANDIGFG